MVINVVYHVGNVVSSFLFVIWNDHVFFLGEILRIDSFDEKLFLCMDIVESIGVIMSNRIPSIFNRYPNTLFLIQIVCQYIT